MVWLLLDNAVTNPPFQPQMLAKSHLNDTPIHMQHNPSRPSGPLSLGEGPRTSNQHPPTPTPMPQFPNDALPSFGGHGTLEALEVVKLLQRKGIPSCMCGVSALIYYGAGRLRQDWEICVPTDKFEAATAAFKLPENSSVYISVPPWPYQQPGSLYHIYPRYKRVGISFYFVLVPDWDCHFECHPSTLQMSSNGLPYPKLQAFMQSLLDTQDQLLLTDLIDATDVSEQWGLDNLQLDGPTDLEWARRKDKLIVEANSGDASTALGVFAENISRRDLWKKLVRTKGARRGWSHPEHLFATQYRLHGSPDPWTQHRECS